ncbi:hypothetical protein MKZ38_008962 [Zalerion maritima]|uniref:Uncharacterized protein n=1 Tax=Zalerion maritima TaxID=339359 RepID=A0AAD5RUL9_9PEZI|nr:hypothetical protein MKZ38_008962 [Zalerion maritima]
MLTTVYLKWASRLRQQAKRQGPRVAKEAPKSRKSANGSCSKPRTGRSNGRSNNSRNGLKKGLSALIQMRVELSREANSGTLELPEHPYRHGQRQRRAQIPLRLPIEAHIYKDWDESLGISSQSSRSSTPGADEEIEDFYPTLANYPRVVSAVAQDPPRASVSRHQATGATLATPPRQESEPLFVTPDRNASNGLDLGDIDYTTPQAQYESPMFVPPGLGDIEQHMFQFPYVHDTPGAGTPFGSAHIHHDAPSRYDSQVPKVTSGASRLRRSQFTSGFDIDMEEGTPSSGLGEVEMEGLVVSQAEESLELTNDAGHNGAIVRSSKRQKPMTCQKPGPQLTSFEMMKLPENVRNVIYRNILCVQARQANVSSEVFVNEGWSEVYYRWTSGIDTSILEANRTINQEALKVLYEQNKFCYVIRDRDLDSSSSSGESSRRQQVDGRNRARKIALRKYGKYFRHLSILLDAGRNGHEYDAAIARSIHDIVNFKAHLHDLTLEFNPRRDLEAEESERVRCLIDAEENGTAYAYEFDPHDQSQKIKVPRVFHQTDHLNHTNDGNKVLESILALDCDEVRVVLNINQQDAGINELYWGGEKMLRISKRVNTKALWRHHQLRLWDMVADERRKVGAELQAEGIPILENDEHARILEAQAAEAAMPQIQEALSKYLKARKKAEEGGISNIFLDRGLMPQFATPEARVQTQKAFEETVEQLGAIRGNIRHLFAAMGEENPADIKGDMAYTPKDLPLPFERFGWEQLPARPKYPWQRRTDAVRTGQ